MPSQIERLQQSLNRVSSPDEQITILHELAWYYAFTESDDDLAGCLRHVQDLFDHNPAALHPHHNPHHAILLAYHQALTEGYIEALKHTLDLVSNHYDLLAPAWQWRIHYLLGRIHSYTGNSGDALTAFHQTLHIASLQSDTVGQFCSLNSLGFAHNYMEDYDDALTYLKRSRVIADKLDDPLFQWMALVNLSHVYAMLRQFDQSEETGKAALQIAHQTQDTRQIGFSTTRIAYLHIERGEYDQAVALLQSTLAVVPDTTKNWHARVVLMRYLARALSGQGQHTTAIEIYTGVLQRAYNKHNMINVLKVLEELSVVYERAGDPTHALHFHKEYFKLYRKFQDERNSMKIHLLETLYHTREAETLLNHQKQLTEEAVRQTEQTKQYFAELDTLKNQFIASATHDLKNPLSGILLHAQLLRRKIGIEFHRHLDLIENGANRMSKLIADMLDVAKLETGSALSLTPNRLSDLLDTVAEESQAAAHQKQIAIHLSGDPELSFCFDAHYLHRCLSNLVDNAIKYSPVGESVHIHAERIPGGHWVQITIKDTGIGIPEADLPHIFERFYRVENPTTKGIDGTGLGLAIVKTIVEQHNGTIKVESQFGVGTTFSIQLPYTETQPIETTILSRP